MFVNARAPGCIQYSNQTYSTLDQCQQLCVDSKSCVAVEFDTSKTNSFGCWVHTNINDLSQLYDGNNYTVSEYQITRTCPGNELALGCLSILVDVCHDCNIIFNVIVSGVFGN